MLYCHEQPTNLGTKVRHLLGDWQENRVKKASVTKGTNIHNRTSIHDRPKEANGTRFDDWEMDLIVDNVSSI